MPRLLVKKTKRNATPPCGRRIDYQVPTSPFQKLIEDRRTKLGLTIREVASPIAEITKSAFHPGTLWIWTHSTNGFPAPKSATPARLAALAQVLKLDRQAMLQALDASRALYTARENPEPQSARDALLVLIEILAADKRRVLNRDWILNLARRLHAGANATGPAIDVPARQTHKKTPRSTT